MPSIAIVGLACRYPEARSPRQLWENVLAQRRSFRRIPQVRLSLDDYAAENQTEDRIYLKTAAVLEDYEFDRVRFQVSQETFASTDLVHWLALDVASQALEDAKLLNSTDQQRERTGVYVGNSLTGEFSRANLLRLRWPYVRRVLAAALEKNGFGHNGDLYKLISEIEALYKAPFPSTTEESLAGGLANTIAGRICNYFNFKGGGYTVDAACASSLLAVTTACTALETGDVDIAIAGGVDLSLDPFELAGFSKLGALATEKMRVFDSRSAGFWPGEGCGMVVLMRHEDAVADHHSPYAVLRGWGISSDGSGGITRPELTGQLLALQRAYKRAEYGMDSVAYFEGHGTGTTVGDAVELQALSQARRSGNGHSAPAALGSIKANIGHTKAAAGVAGLIKAAMAVQSRILPPTTGCDTPHPELAAEKPALRILKTGELWPDNAPPRAGVSAMGFGGINTHVTLEATDNFRRRKFTAVEQQQLASAQDCELFLFQAEDRVRLALQLEAVAELAGEISFAEMADLATALANQIPREVSAESVRAACVAAIPDELQSRLNQLAALCHNGNGPEIRAGEGVFLGSGSAVARIGFLFTGQSAPVRNQGGIWARRFPAIRELYRRADLPATASIATETAQPCIVAASLAGLHGLNLCGIQASVALGHSLGEITALHWAGAFDEQTLAAIIRQRGQIMAETTAAQGAMASIHADSEEVKRRINGDHLTIAAYNSPLSTVISGEALIVRQFAARLGSEGVSATVLPVSHAFHSPLMTDSAAKFSASLSGRHFDSLRRPVVSTVTGSFLPENADLHQLLSSQITMPVQFAAALAVAAAEADLFIEVGPGDVLTGIVAECTDKPVIALNVAGESLQGLLLAAGAAFILNNGARPQALFENRFVRSFDLKWRHTFLQNPCEMVPASPALTNSLPAPPTPVKEIVPARTGSPLDVLRQLIAERTQLPLVTIKNENRFLDDLHLNSITVSQIILQAATQLNLPLPVAPSEYANVTIAQAAETLEKLRGQSPAPVMEKIPPGIQSWLRVLAVEFTERELRSVSPAPHGEWQILAMPGHPLSSALQNAFHKAAGSGVVVCTPPERDENAAAFLLDCAQQTLRQKVQQIVFVGAGAAALARSLYLEHPNVKVTVVDAPADHPQAAEWIAGEANAASRFTEVHYDHAGIRREPRLKLLWPEQNDSAVQLGPSDVLLVTGGGKGIAAECALELARASQCCLALLGRSLPERDPELKTNLDRFTASGIRFRYFPADVTDAAATREAIHAIESTLGSVTAVLHGAGVNSPRHIEELTAADLSQTLAPKVAGLRNILAAVDPEKLHLLITFGSVIARTGLHGEAHYGLANQWLAEIVEHVHHDHPRCRALNLDWSVWAGAGMGQRLGVLDSLARQGITPLPLDEAINSLKEILTWKQAPASCIITGRFGKLPTLRFPGPEIPLLRFLEHIEIYYPGIELIADATLSSKTDPYISDHVFQSEELLPAVVGMEAMAQAAMTLEKTQSLPELRDLRFEHPIVVPARKPVRIRIAALRRRPGHISVAIRCAATSFQVDHFSAECVFPASELAREASTAVQPANQNGLALDPASDLYGHILFHQGRFRRVQKYLRLQADESLAHLSAPSASPWFARHLPAELVTGDPASRDSALHSIQACIPHRTILPVGVGRITASASWTRERATVHAVERARDRDDFIYDLTIADAAGKICEQWEGLHLRAVAPIGAPESWPLPLLAPFLERKLNEFFPAAALKVAFDTVGEEPTNTDALLVRILGLGATLTHRSDGQPEVSGCPDARVSLSHSSQLTLIVSANCALGCDLEPVAARQPDLWSKLLGDEGFSLAELVAKKSNLPFNTSATIIWTLKESLRKSGASLDQSFRFETVSNNWLLFSAGDFSAAAVHLRINNQPSPFCVAFVVRKPA